MNGEFEFGFLNSRLVIGIITLLDIMVTIDIYYI